MMNCDCIAGTLASTIPGTGGEYIFLGTFNVSVYYPANLRKTIGDFGGKLPEEHFRFVFVYGFC